MEKFFELDAQTILPEVWANYFMDKPDNLGMSMSAKLAKTIKSRLQDYPMFILPIPRLTGQEILFMESIVGDNFIVQVTGLEEYKRLGPQAPIRASFTFFMEMINSKDLTLVMSHFDGSKINSTQISQLLQNFCAAYSQDELFKMIKDFRDNPNDFDFDKFMKLFTIQ